MDALRTWTVPGDVPLTITLHQPAVTLRSGEGPEVTLSQEQVAALSARMLDAENFFECGDPEILA